MHEVIISYSTKDKKWADAACSVLEVHGIRCWIAPRDIAPGTEWGAAIVSGIDACKIMVLIFSASANESPQVRREVERAISKGLAIVPCRVENVTPVGAMEYALGNTHWLDVFTSPVERQMTRLAESVQALLPPGHLAPSLDAPSPAASGSAYRSGSIRTSSLSTWNWRGKQGRVTAGTCALLLVVAGLLFAFLPRKHAASIPANEAFASDKPANDYDAIATGDWVPLLASQEDFQRILAEKSFAGSSYGLHMPKFDRGTLEFNDSSPPYHGQILMFPSVQAKNAIIRARVRKITPAPPNDQGSHIQLSLRCTQNVHCGALFAGRRRLAVGWRHPKWEDLREQLLAVDYDQDFFEFAFAAIDDKLFAYVNGRKILEYSDPVLAQLPPGTVRILLNEGVGLFQNIEVQVLDKPAPNSPPTPVESSNSGLNATQKSPTAGTTATPAGVDARQTRPEPEATKKAPSDYDQIATGQWFSPLASLEEFSGLLTHKRYFGRKPKFDGGLLELQCPPGTPLTGLGLPGTESKNVIVRMRVRKLLPPPPHIAWSCLHLALHSRKQTAYSLFLKGRNTLAIMRCYGKQTTLKSCKLADGFDEGSFDLAYAAIDDKLTVYVNGRKVMECVEPALVNTSGTVELGVNSCGGLFRDIEVQVLDTPASTPQPAPLKGG